MMNAYGVIDLRYRYSIPTLLIRAFFIAFTNNSKGSNLYAVNF